MPMSKKSSKPDVCEGCLSSGRRLEMITDHLRLYTMLMEDVLGEKMKYKKIPSMCLKCRRILKSMQDFQKMAEETYKSLLMNIDSNEEMIHNPNPIQYAIPMTIPDRGTSDDEIKLNSETKSETTILNTNTENDDKTEFECTIEEIKEENELDVKMENECVDTDSINGETDFTEFNDETTVKQETNEIDKKIGNKITKQERAKRKAKYKIIRKIDRQGLTDVCLAVKIDEEERQRCIEFEKTIPEYLKSDFKCDTCIVGFGHRYELVRHLVHYHSESNPYECDVCKVRVTARHLLMKHVKTHNFKYVCSLCNYHRLDKKSVIKHLSREHRVAYECRKCGLRFGDNYWEFYRHYKNMHKYFVCDHCGFQSTTKERLKIHIEKQHPEGSGYVCKYCNKKYVRYYSMTDHIAMRHTKEVSEVSYCVECNMQFDNTKLYTRHLKTSVKHKPKIVFPCTECEKVYAKKKTMMYHYRLVHLKQTKYYCDKCSKYFLNGFRLRLHREKVHDKIQLPKNKICSYCGRGFSTNTILMNHIRTHTGERPFACTHCPATFTQKYALVTHTRGIHKDMMKYSTIKRKE